MNSYNGKCYRALSEVQKDLLNTLFCIKETTSCNFKWKLHSWMGKFVLKYLRNCKKNGSLSWSIAGCELFLNERLTKREGKSLHHESQCYRFLAWSSLKLAYTISVPESQRTHNFSITNFNQLMLFRILITIVYFVNLMKPKRTNLFVCAWNPWSPEFAEIMQRVSVRASHFHHHIS